MNKPLAASCTGLRILVVGDNADTLDLLQQLLTYAGAAVRAVSSAREALAALDDVDVVITDYSMLRHTVPLAELSRTPFARVLRKPVDPWALCAIVREVADGA